MSSKPTSATWPNRLLTLLIWALTAGSAVFWWLHSGGEATEPQAFVSGISVPQATSVDSAVVARALGAMGDRQQSAMAPAELSGRVRLHGVITHGSGGAALIAVDGGVARPVRVGYAPEGLEEGWVLHTVDPHAATLVQGEQLVRFEMPPQNQRSRAGDAVAPGAEQSNPALNRSVARAAEESRTYPQPPENVIRARQEQAER